MNHRIELDDDTAVVLQKLTDLTGLAGNAIIERHLGSVQCEWHELLALVDAHPDLRESAANLIVSLGPESLAAGIKRIAPPDYETLGERFKREMSEVMGEQRAVSS